MDKQQPTTSDDDPISSFLDNVQALRGDDTTVRSTAHTSRVSAEGWLPAEQNPGPDTAA
ncbi:hypothetical protein PUR49_10745 [Streptomyces sp. BE147]|uniref:hypothetical protein n=1 Tax=Streptomyces sp. BE147 TaxID=3002524 RepID=UPI002E772452|nr:hypothetical protein [Streptomyces sp. BE147]MEE1736975.1 hypothetical protein [Streptomyces sp. BE147]